MANQFFDIATYANNLRTDATPARADWFSPLFALFPDSTTFAALLQNYTHRASIGAITTTTVNFSATALTRRPVVLAKDGRMAMLDSLPTAVTVSGAAATYYIYADIGAGSVTLQSLATAPASESTTYRIPIGEVVWNGSAITSYTSYEPPTGAVTSLSAGTTGEKELRIEAATLPDASGTGNNPPEIVREVSSGAQTTNTPKGTATLAKFDAATDEHLIWTLMVPNDWSSGGTIRGIAKAATATSGNVIWKAGIYPTTNSSTDDDAVVATAGDLSSAWAAPGTQGQTVEFTIALTTTNLAVNRLIRIFIGRDADNASDTMTGDAILIIARFEYTRS